MSTSFTLKVSTAVAVSLACFHLYTALQGTFYPFEQRSIPLLLAVVIVFLSYRANGDSSGEKPAPLYDWLMALLALPAFGYIAMNSDHLQERWPMTTTFAPTWMEVTCGMLGIILLLEATRRVMGWILVIGAVLSLLYCYFGHHIPWGMLSHRGFTAIQILDHMYLTLEGIWGVALGVAAAYIVLFIIFGAVAEKAGTADFCIEFANALAGHTRGGPAKVAIFSSALIGSVSGSSVANVYTTGQFTIPMMKRLGYKPRVAAAIEALASNGGQIMPPVLGAAAFLIAAYTGLPYYHIALASLLPAMLYFLGLYWYIHLEAHKTGLVGIPRDEKPTVAAVLIRSGHLFLPLLLLIGLLAYGYSPIKSAFYAIVGTVVVSWFRKETRLWPKDIVRALEAGARSSVMIIVTCAVVGFIIGAFTLTGLALNLGSAIIALAGGQFFLILVFIGIACIVLGMGMNTVAAFVLVSVIAVPALLTQGVDKLTANMFVFYFSLLSHITPPVCLAVFAAASIAGAGPWQTALTGVRMGSIAYILPFLIVFAPSLLLQGSPTRIAVDAGTSLLGAMFLISAIQGWLFTRMNVPERLLSLAAGALLLWPSTYISLAGGALGLLTSAISLTKSRVESSR